MEQTECSEMSHKIQMPGNHPKEGIQLSEHGEIFKSRMLTDRLFSCPVPYIVIT
jgi:hypothetical protein